MLVIGGPASPKLAKEIARNLECTYLDIERSIFSDGESKLTLDGKIPDRVVIVQSCYHPQDKHLLELLFLLRKVSTKASKVCLVVPYLAYSRQDKAFKSGELVSARLLAHLLQKAGCQHLITVDVHSEKVLDFYKSARSVMPIQAFKSYLARKKLQRPVFIAPDEKALRYARSFAAKFSGKTVVLKKERNLKTGKLQFEVPQINLAGSDCIICDDIIATGGTMLAGVSFAKASGAGRIFVLATHGLFLKESLKKLKNSATELAVTDSIPQKGVRTLSLAKSLAKEIDKWIQF